MSIFCMHACVRWVGVARTDLERWKQAVRNDGLDTRKPPRVLNSASLQYLACKSAQIYAIVSPKKI